MAKKELKEEEMIESCGGIKPIVPIKKKTIEDCGGIMPEAGKLTNVEKLEYKRSYFDLSIMRIGARIITEIRNDGTIVSKEYKAGSRKINSIKKAKCSLEEFQKICNEIELCIENADRLDSYVDDTSAELKIFYRYGRIQTMDRGLGNDSVHIGKIIGDFLGKYLSDK